MAVASAAFPEKAAALFKPAPYKVLHGGRGASKTWDFCRAMLILGARRKLYNLCAREIQKSIRDSVHRVLWTQIDALNLNKFYDVQDQKISGINGTQFVFAGIRNNITSIKSMEGIDICAVFEATFVSQHSWEVLLPTVRRDAPFGPFGRGSEVWIEFNPELATDYTYKYWVFSPPPDTVVIEANWRDNPWFPETLCKLKDDLRKRDYDSYLTVWEGKVRRVVQGAIYARELEKAQNEGRINPKILVDRGKPVDIGADLGRADTTSLWFMQQIGMEHHAVDYYSNFGHDWAHFLEEIQSRRYIIGKIYLPHDAEHKHLAANKSIKRQTQDAYPGDGRVIVVPKTASVVNDINAVRQWFPRACFNERTCADGLTGLAHYRFDVDPETKEVSRVPMHNFASHPADGLRTYVMGLKDGGERRAGPQLHQPAVPPRRADGLGWMGR